MRNINCIIVHCSDSDYNKHDNIETIRKWHVEENHWSDIGYHYVITKDGAVHPGRNIQREGAHTKGFNENSIGICVTGKRKFSPEQFASLKELCEDLMEQYGLERYDVLHHRDFDQKRSCPNFNLTDVFMTRSLK